MTRMQTRTPLFLKVRNYVLEHIQHHKWRANDRLPTEAELAKQFDVSRFTVKKALDDLVTEGLVYRIQGKGSFVSPISTEENSYTVLEGSISASFKPIALLMPSIQGSLTANLLAGVEEQLTAQGYHVFFRATNNEQEQERLLLRECVQLGVKGVIIFPVDGESYSEDILRLTLNKFPVVVIDRYLRGLDTNCVCSDNVGGAYNATSHLIELGHTHIAYFGLRTRMTTSVEDRLLGYEKALIEHHIPIDYHLSLSEWSEENDEVSKGSPDYLSLIQRTFRTFFQENPNVTAVFAVTSEIGIAAIEAATELGIHVPEQLSVIFFDDYVNAFFSRIPPSCVVQPEKQVGVEAAKLLVSIMNNPLQERRKITLPTELVLRKSTARVRGNLTATFPLPHIP
jgi:GntR family transcriptional regulator, arabinose operon transcriptional repressor